MNNDSCFGIDESSSSNITIKNSGIFLNKKLFIIIIVVFVILLIVLPIITYYSRSCKSSSSSNFNENTVTITKPTDPSTSGPTVPPEDFSYRIPPHLKPYKYEIKINSENISSDETIPEYLGEVDIFFTCIKNTNKLIFHIKNSTIDNSTLTLKSLQEDQDFKDSLTNFTWRNDFEREFFIAEFSSDIFKKDHNYSIHIEYTGFLKTDNIGFYRSSYSKTDGTKQ